MIDEKVKPRWPNLHHFYINESNRQIAKKQLGFQSAPFYVAVDKAGRIQNSGNPANFDVQQALLELGYATFLVPGHSRMKSNDSLEKKTKIAESAKRTEPNHPINNLEITQLDRVFSIDNEF
jgi:hypothetical protein